jgi:undecaprenyl diphosphate synthase
MQSVTKSPAEAAQRVPQHVAVIMDGNGRWARARGLPALAGHRAGVEVIRKLLRACREHGISVLTLFAFSSENWQRPPDEVRGLMALFARYLRREVRELDASGIRIRIIGDRERFGPRIGRLMAEAEQQTVANTASTLVIARITADSGTSCRLPAPWRVRRPSGAWTRSASMPRTCRLGCAWVSCRRPTC